jgi:hypothetical protein
MVESFFRQWLMLLLLLLLLLLSFWLLSRMLWHNLILS